MPESRLSQEEREALHRTMRERGIRGSARRWAGTVAGRRVLRDLRADLGEQMRKVLAALELVSCGRTSPPRLTVAAVSPRPGERMPSSTPSFESSPPTTGDFTPPHLHYRRLWDEAETDERRRTVLEEAQATLKLLRVAPAPGRGESVEDRNRRCLAFEDFEAGQVAIEMRMSETEVRKLRIADGRDPEWGRPTIAHVLPSDATPDQRAQHARYLSAEHGLGPRQIATLIGVTRETVHRYLRTARRAA